MKARRNLFIGLILGAVIGWALGFLRFPYIEENSSFLLGFIACIACILFVLILLLVWNKNSQLIRLIIANSATENSKKIIRTYVIIWSLASVFILLGGAISSFFIYKQNELNKISNDDQTKKINEQSELIESSRRSNMVILMNDILDKVDEDLENNSKRTLSEKTIARIIAAFNYSFEPYRYWDGDSVSEEALSPEKGQLILALTKKNIDSISFQKIKLGSSFYGADLRGANLSGVNLSGCDLKGADFQDSDLMNSNFSGTDLRGTNLSGAKLNNANMHKADLRRADLRWAEMNEIKLDSANLNGAVLTNAQLRKADLHAATFHTAKLDGALLNEANLERGYIVDASLIKANLTKVNLTKVDANRTNFNEAIMMEIILTDTDVDKDWLEKLNGWKVTGAKEIQKNYKIVQYEVAHNVLRYRLEKIKL
jgi:uncharacterized protein YjbI with pentapeptide repeats